MENLLNPFLLFFLAGIFAGLIKSDLKIPKELYEGLTILLLITIGLKGGITLNQSTWSAVALPAVATVLLGIGITGIAYVALLKIGHFSRENSAGIAAHYGSVSVGTYAVALEAVSSKGLPVEGFLALLLILLEMPAIITAIFLVQVKDRSGKSMKSVFKDVLFGKSIYLLLLGLVIGWMCGKERTAQITPLFFGLFEGALALFLLEMGLISSRKLSDLKEAGPFLTIFAFVMPLIGGMLGLLTARSIGLSEGGAVMLGTMCASASYIAAPAAIRIAVPKANPTYYLTASLGLTFPFNVIVGIPIYIHIANQLYA